MVTTAATFRPNRRPRSYYVSRLFTLWLPLAFFLVFTLLPFWYMLVISLKDQQLEVNDPKVFPFWPFHPNLNQYIDLFARTQFPRWALNTTIIASLSTIVSLTFGTLAGYALARLRFRGASLLGIISFVTYLVPQTLLFIPLNIVITRLPVPLFLVTVVFSTVAVGLPLLMLFIPPEKRVGWGPLASWLPAILLFGIGVSLGLWGLTAKGAALNEIDLGGATNLSNTMWALILTYPTFLVPFCTWLLTGYFQSIPRELEESALIDGASRMQAMLRIIVSDTGEVLKIPNQALRFRADRAGSPTLQADKAVSASEPGTPAVVWIPGGNRRPTPLAVRVGVNDEVSAQLVAGPLTEGQPVIVGVANLQSGAGLFGFRLGF